MRRGEFYSPLCYLLCQSLSVAEMSGGLKRMFIRLRSMTELVAERSRSKRSRNSDIFAVW